MHSKQKAPCRPKTSAPPACIPISLCCPNLLCLQTFRLGVLKPSTVTWLIFYSKKVVIQKSRSPHPVHVIHSNKPTKPWLNYLLGSLSLSHCLVIFTLGWATWGLVIFLGALNHNCRQALSPKSSQHASAWRRLRPQAMARILQKGSQHPVPVIWKTLHNFGSERLSLVIVWWLFTQL